MGYSYSKLVTELPAPRLAAYIRAELERQRLSHDPRLLDPIPADEGERQRVLAAIPMPEELRIDDGTA